MTKKQKVLIAIVIAASVLTVLFATYQMKAGVLDGWYQSKETKNDSRTGDYLHFHDGHCDIYRINTSDNGKSHCIMTAHTYKKADVIGPYETAYSLSDDENGLYAVHNRLKHTISVENTKASETNVKHSCYTRMDDTPEFLKTDLTDDTPSTGY